MVIDPYLDLNSSKLEGKFLTLVGYLILLKMTVGAFLAVQWLRLRFQCRRCEFNPWLGN